MADKESQEQNYAKLYLTAEAIQNIKLAAHAHPGDQYAKCTVAQLAPDVVESGSEFLNIFQQNSLRCPDFELNASGVSSILLQSGKTLKQKKQPQTDNDKEPNQILKPKKITKNQLHSELDKLLGQESNKKIYQIAPKQGGKMNQKITVVSNLSFEEILPQELLSNFRFSSASSKVDFIFSTGKTTSSKKFRKSIHTKGPDGTEISAVGNTNEHNEFDINDFKPLHCLEIKKEKGNNLSECVPQAVAHSAYLYLKNCEIYGCENMELASHQIEDEFLKTNKDKFANPEKLERGYFWSLLWQPGNFIFVGVKRHPQYCGIKYVYTKPEDTNNENQDKKTATFIKTINQFLSYVVEFSQTIDTILKSKKKTQRPFYSFIDPKGELISSWNANVFRVDDHIIKDFTFFPDFTSTWLKIIALLQEKKPKSNILKLFEKDTIKKFAVEMHVCKTYPDLLCQITANELKMEDFVSDTIACIKDLNEIGYSHNDARPQNIGFFTTEMLAKYFPHETATRTLYTLLDFDFCEKLRGINEDKMGINFKKNEMQLIKKFGPYARFHHQFIDFFQFLHTKNNFKSKLKISIS